MTTMTPFTVSIAEATKIVGIGRTSLYAAISKRKLKVKKSGRRTLIEMAELQKFVDELPDHSGPQNKAA